MEEIVKKIKECFFEITQNARTVCSIFTEYFGEELVDCILPKEEVIINTILSYPFRVCCHPYDTGSNIEIKVGSDSYLIPYENYNKIKDIPLSELVNTECKTLIDKVVDFNALVNALTSQVTIIVKFPQVTVTNEYGNSIDITGLYAKVLVNKEGTMADRFSLFRTEYTMTQYRAGYAHSHMPSTDLVWQFPCLGSGPIVSTIHSLNTKYDEQRWGLFCYELAKYVTIESVEGVPFRYLSKVNQGSNNTTLTRSTYRSSLALVCNRKTIVKNFIEHMIKTLPIKLSYRNGYYTLGESFYNFYLRLSECYIQWAKTSSYRLEALKSLLQLSCIINNKVYYVYENRAAQRGVEQQGRVLFKFKGEDVKFKITDKDDSPELYLLKDEVVTFILTSILRIINYHYGEENSEENSGTEERNFYY